MKIKAVLDSLEGLDEGLKALYVERNGKYYLDADGVEFEDDVKGLKNALERERKQARQLSEMLKKFDGIEDPAAALEAIKKLGQLEEKNLIDSGEIEQLVNKRTENMRKNYETQVSKLTGSYDEAKALSESLRKELTTLKIDNQLQSIGAKVGVRPEAMEDFLYRGKKIFNLDENGKLVPVDREGNTVFGKDGKAPISMEEWSGDLQQAAPHLFLGSGGSNAMHGGGGGGGFNTNRTITTKDLNSGMVSLEDIATGKVQVQ